MSWLIGVVVAAIAFAAGFIFGLKINVDVAQYTLKE
jgi:hypothetical protein